MQVYKIINSVNQKVYVGVTKQTIEKRLAGHFSCARNDGKTHLYSAMRQYGFENFSIHHIEYAETQEDLFLKEQYWIRELNTYCHGYNETRGGAGAPDNKISSVTKEKLKNRSIRRGWKHSEAAKAKVSKAAMGNARCKGRIISEQHKQILQQTGKKTMTEKNPMASAESRAKVSAARKGMKRQYLSDGSFVMVRSNGN